MNVGDGQRPGVAECRVAARAVRRSERGRDVLRLVRPRGVLPLIRSTPPLTVQLYLGAVGGRLVWRDAGAFGLLEEPASSRLPAAASPADRGRRLVRRHWELLVFGTPPVVFLSVAGACALAVLLGAPWRGPLAVTAIVAVTAIPLWVAVHMLASVLSAGLSFVRILEGRRQSPEARAFDLYRWENWSLVLLHVVDGSDIAEVLAAARERAGALAQESSGQRDDDPPVPDRARSAEPGENALLCVERGITTQAARDEVRIAGGVTRLGAALPGVLLVHEPGRPAPPRQPVKSVQGASFILGGSAVVLAVVAFFLAAAERSACGPSHCAGRPATYQDALTWLAYKLLFQTPDGIATGTQFGRFLGLTLPVLGLTLAAVVGTALWRSVRASQALDTTYVKGVEDMAIPATAVILTALDLEYEAVRAHLAEPLGTAQVRGTHFELGTFTGQHRGWTVALAQTGAGNTSAGIHLDRAVERFAPSLALFVGIAGGLKDVRLGDVVVADHVYDYETGKDGEDAFLPRIKTEAPSYPLLQLAAHVARRGRWRIRLGKDRPDSGPDTYVKPIAAGSKVVSHDRSATARLLKQVCGDAVAVEMEGYGFLRGAYVNRGTDALVVRGISDLLTDKTEANDRIWQPAAARNAAAFAFELLADIDPAALHPHTASPGGLPTES